MKLLDIAYRAKPRMPIQRLTEAMITRVAGLEGDSRGKPNNRQVTVLSASQWQTACAELGTELSWTARRANLLVDGLEFSKHHVGKQIKIGEMRMVIMGETDPCSKMDQQHQGLSAALSPDWRGGVCCKVIDDGRVKLGDTVQLID